MGLGIISENGAKPLKEWGLRIRNLGSPELADAVRSLLAGEAVKAVDGVREISVLAGRGEEYRITIRLPEAPYVADLYLEARDRGDLMGVPPDPRSSIPSPDAWISSDGGATTTWELFNCVIQSLQTRDNTP
jgi:hypothetical protein